MHKVKQFIMIQYSHAVCRLGAALERIGERLFTHGLRTNPELEQHWKEVDAVFKGIKDMQKNFGTNLVVRSKPRA